MKTKNTKNMLTIGLLIIAVLALSSMACEESGGGEDILTSAIEKAELVGNDFADTIDEGARELGIPNQTSGEIYELLFQESK